LRREMRREMCEIIRGEEFGSGKDFMFVGRCKMRGEIRGEDLFERFLEEIFEVKEEEGLERRRAYRSSRFNIMEGMVRLFSVHIEDRDKRCKSL
jgi:hypothetical protein